MTPRITAYRKTEIVSSSRFIYIYPRSYDEMWQALCDDEKITLQTNENGVTVYYEFLLNGVKAQLTKHRLTYREAKLTIKEMHKLRLQLEGKDADAKFRPDTRVFCLKCGSYQETTNANALGDPAYDRIICSECGANEEFLTDDIADVVEYIDTTYKNCQDAIVGVS